MKTSASKAALLSIAFAVGTIALAPAAMAANPLGGVARMYRFTVTNATLGQPVAPSVIATHSDAFQLFELGPAPTPGDADYDRYFALATVAETGYPFLLRDQLAASAGVWEAKALPTDRTPPILLPGESNSITIGALGDAKYLSAAAMLGATNDAFYAVRNVRLPLGIGDSVHIGADAYDAGSEANAESAATVGALGATDDDPLTGTGINANGEGYIFVHAGIHGVGGSDGLDAATHDWRNPVVEITIERIQ